MHKHTTWAAVALVVMAVLVTEVACRRDGAHYGRPRVDATAMVTRMTRQALGLLQDGRLQEALDVYERSFEVSSDAYRYDRLMNVVYALSKLERYVEAVPYAEEAHHLNATAATHRALGFLLYVRRDASQHDWERAEVLLGEAVSMPGGGESGNSFLYLGDLLFGRGAYSEARRRYKRALRLLGSRKALRKLGFTYRRLGSLDKEEALYAEAVASGLLPNSAQQRSDTITPGLSAHAWHAGAHGVADSSEFAWLPLLEHEIGRTIAPEFARLLGSLDSAPFADVGRGGGAFAHDDALYAASGRRWQELVLFEQGVPGDGAHTMIETVTALRRIVPDALDYGRCVVSLVEAGVHIVPHTGPTNERLTVHCALHLPSAKVGVPTLRVGDDVPPQTWEVGKCWVFDDSFEHEVAFPRDAAAVEAADSEADALRAILLFHIPHPQLDRSHLEVDEEAIMRQMFGAHTE